MESQLEGKVYNQDFLAKINKTKQNIASNGFIATCHLLYDSFKAPFQTSTDTSSGRFIPLK